MFFFTVLSAISFLILGFLGLGPGQTVSVLRKCILVWLLGPLADLVLFFWGKHGFDVCGAVELNGLDSYIWCMSRVVSDELRKPDAH